MKAFGLWLLVKQDEGGKIAKPVGHHVRFSLRRTTKGTVSLIVVKIDVTS